jgi:tetratricopeptide (TPR) repeat protein/TolB-like protein
VLIYVRQVPAPSKATSPVAPLKSRKSVAVLSFKNNSGNPNAEWLSTALSEMLTTELAATEKLRTISGENVARMRTDLALPIASSFAADTLTRIRTNIGSDYVVLGSYVIVGEKPKSQIRLDVVVQDALTGTQMAPVTSIGREAELLDLVSRTGKELREKLGAGQLSESQQVASSASKPSNTEAAEFYAKGLFKLRQYDYLAAQELLEKAVSADPKYAPSHARLSEAYGSLGYQAKADAELEKAYNLSKNLPREEKLLIEAEYHSSRGETEKALKIYEILYGFFPDNVDYGVNLASLQYEVYKGKEALSTLAELRRLPSPLRDNPQIDLTEADITEDFNRALIVSRSAIKKAETSGAQFVAAAAKMKEALILKDMNRGAEARKIFLELSDYYAKTGNPNMEAWALQCVARTELDLAERLKLFERIKIIYQKIGNVGGLAGIQLSIARLHGRMGDPLTARKLSEDALAEARKGGDKRTIAEMLYDLGKPEEALSIHREIGDLNYAAQDQFGYAGKLFHQGELETALKNAREALPVLQKNTWKDLEKADMYLIGRILLAQGKIKEARAAIERALGKDDIFKSSTVIAGPAFSLLLLEEGRLKEAEDVLHKFGLKYQNEHRLGGACVWLGWEARALLEQGKVSEAQKAIEEAVKLLSNNHDVENRLIVEISAARVRAAANPAQSSKEIAALQKVIADARKERYLDYEFEARLALGEVQLKAGNSKAAEATLKSLYQDARKKDFGLIAGKASKLLSMT